MPASALNDALPILLLIVVGVLVRLSGLVDRNSRLVLTRLVYYVTIPAAIFTSIARAELSRSMLLLPVIGFVLPCLLAGIIFIATRGIAHRPEQRGVLLVANVVLVVFAYPFFEVFFGVDGLARMAMFDVGNAIFAGSVALWLAQSFGTRKNGLGRLNWRRVVTSPLLVAAVAGIGFALFELPLEGPFGAVMHHLRLANTPLAMIAVGAFLEPKASHTRLIGIYVGLRMALGGLLGWAAALALGMTGLDVVTACVGSAMPSGTTALVYAGAEGLDAEFAASLISSTLLVGIVVISVLPPLLVGIYGI